MLRRLCRAFFSFHFSLLIISAPAAAQVPSGAAVVVLPFENTTQEPRLAWMREGAAILLTESLAAAGEIVVNREERLQAFDRLQIPANANLSRATTIRIGHSVNSTLVIGG